MSYIQEKHTLPKNDEDIFLSPQKKSEGLFYTLEAQNLTHEKADFIISTCRCFCKLQY